MYPAFEWDETKAKANVRKHKISFGEAATVFHDPFIASMPDPNHSRNDEQRVIAIGRSTKGRLLVVVYTEREGRIRVISCRKAIPTERRVYEEDGS